MEGVLRLAQREIAAESSYYVGQAVELTDDAGNASGTIRRPDGSNVTIEGRVPADVMNQPGVYQLNFEQQSYPIAVNLAMSESQTAPMPVEKLETYGVKLGRQPSQSEQLSQLRKAKDAELEGRQKIWKWLLAAALTLLVAETILAGRKQTKTAEVGAATT